jgi:UPF0755 protein
MLVIVVGGLAALAVATGMVMSTPSPEGPPAELTIPPGASFQDVTDTLESRGVLLKPGLFKIYARAKGLDTQVRSGRYALPTPAPWSRILRDLTEGRVLTEGLTIPEGFTLKQMAPRIAAITGLEESEVLSRLSDPEAHTEWGVPGPGLEGFLFPDTYRFASGVPLSEVLATMVSRYQGLWTEERRAVLSERGLTEQEVVTLASIIQAEARLRSEMPTIASVYDNRLQRNHLLQADPTVLYALGGPRARLLYAAMDSVADSPYNTYTHVGLPPGPIGAPGTAAIDAALEPAETDLFYFVAHPDGSHVFSVTLAEHNRAVAETRRERDRLRREQAAGEGG